MLTAPALLRRQVLIAPHQRQVRPPDRRRCPNCAQASQASFKSIVEAVLSWQTLHNEGLAADILQMLNLHKVCLTPPSPLRPMSCFLQRNLQSASAAAPGKRASVP